MKKDLLIIRANIYVEKENHKAIIIGKKGQMLKRSAKRQGRSLNIYWVKRSILSSGLR